MEDSQATVREADKDLELLVNCGICHTEMEQPKTLVCLHSFCVKCLRQVDHPPDKITCPLCQEDTLLPTKGIDGLRDSVFITQLKERRAICRIGDVQTRMMCMCCRASDRVNVARCTECNGFLCQPCVDLHDNIAPLKPHTVFTLEELMSGNVAFSKLVKEECCTRHKDQVLVFFCKTCGVPTCRICTIVEHCRPDHEFVTLESVIEGQTREIEMLLATCRDVAQKTDAVIKREDKVKSELKDALAKASQELLVAKEKKKNDFLKRLEDEHNSNLDQLEKIQEERRATIENNKAKLTNLEAKLKNAMELANQVLVLGSKHDVASNYAPLTSTLKQLKDARVEASSDDTAYVCFIPDESEQTMKPLGKIRAKKPTLRHDVASINSPSTSTLKQVEEESVDVTTECAAYVDSAPESAQADNIMAGKSVLTVQTEMGKIGRGKLKRGFGVAVSSNGDIAVADNNGREVKVFTSGGEYKFSLDTKQEIPRGKTSYPWDVAASHGQFYVTDRTGVVKKYNSTGAYLMQFAVKSTDGILSDIDESELRGLAMDNDDHLLVGNYSKKYIARYTRDGTRITTFTIHTDPDFIAVAPSGRIVVSPNIAHAGVHVLDATGMFIIVINAPNGVKSWSPTGVCCSNDGNIYIASCDSKQKGGIYSFTENGEYKGCVTTDVRGAVGLAYSNDGVEKLVVGQDRGRPAKVFTFN